MSYRQFRKAGESGIIVGEPNDTYHQTEGCLSASRLEVFRDRPRKFRDIFVERSQSPDRSAALELGQTAHDMILFGRDWFNVRYYVQPEVNASTNKGKAELAQARLANKGKIATSRADHATATAMQREIIEHGIAGRMLQHGLPEVTFRTRQIAGMPEPMRRFQCKFDYLIETDHGTFRARDLKTTSNLDGFVSREISKHGYAHKAAFYMLTANVLHGVKADPAHLFAVIDEWVWIAIESKPPYEPRVVIADREQLESAAEQVVHSIARLAQCYTANHWPFKYPDSEVSEYRAWASAA